MITVCIATYNGEKYIKEQLHSILIQLNENDEIVISDDSSTDNTIQIIEEINDRRIKLLRFNKFRSPIYNIENALKQAQGDFIFLSDQDDVWLPNKIKETLKQINSENVVMSDAMLCDSHLNTYSNTLNTWRIYKPGFIHNIFQSRYLGCCMAFHRNKLKEILPFPKNLPAHDMWIGLLAETTNSLTYLPISLIKYRRHETNYSSASNKSKNSLLYKITYRCHFLLIVINRIVKIKLKI